jgi:ligand-binding sensor domain-containing protein
MPALISQPIRLWAVCGFIVCVNLLVFSQGTTPEARTASDDYLIKTWDTEDNLSGSTVTSILQTPDGYLWVGTYEGLTRFDGVHSVTFDSLNTPALSHSRIQGLYLDTGGTLWINTYRGGLTSFRNGVFRREWPDQPDFDLHTMMVSSSSNQVTFVTQFGEILKGSVKDTNTSLTVLNPPGNSRPRFQCVDGGGTLWFLSREGRILRVVNGQYSQLPSDSGLANTRVLTLTSDANGQVWAGAVNEIARWNGQSFEDVTPTNMDSSKEFDPITLFPTSNGAVWVLANDRLREEIDRHWTAEATEWRGLLGSASNRAMGVHEDQNGGIWFNHYGNGVFYITPAGRFERFTVRNGLPGDRVGAWFQDRDGGIWLGVDRGGLVRLSTRHFQMIGQADGLPVWAGVNGLPGCRSHGLDRHGGGRTCVLQRRKSFEQQRQRYHSREFYIFRLPRIKRQPMAERRRWRRSFSISRRANSTLAMGSSWRQVVAHGPRGTIMGGHKSQFRMVHRNFTARFWRRRRCGRFGRTRIGRSA